MPVFTLSKYNIILFSLLVIAFSLRFGIVVQRPLEEVGKDSIHYDDIAVNLISGNGFSLSNKHLLPGDRMPSGEPQPTARRPFLYPVFLALIYKIFGRNFAAVGVVQSLIGVLTCYLIFLLSVRVSNRITAGLIAAGASALYLPFVRFTNALLTETLFLFLVVLTFDYMYRALKKEKISLSALAGILCGLSFLCRPTAVGFPVIFLLLIFLSRKYGYGKSAALKVTIYMLAFFMIYFGWVVRNYRAFGTFVPGFTSAGYNLFLGSYPPAKGRPNISLEEHPEELRKELEGKGEIEANRIFMRAAVENVKQAPGTFLELIAMKLIRSWFNVPLGNYWLPSARSLLLNGPVLLLAVAGFIVMLRRDMFSAIFLASPVFYFTGFHALVVSSIRYNLPSMLFAIILLSIAIDRIAEVIREH